MYAHSNKQELQVNIDIGAVGDKHGQLPPSYGTLLRPTEEGRAGDRVARAARFMGTYQEFKNHCRDLPGLLRPHVALWADAFWLATEHCHALSIIEWGEEEKARLNLVVIVDMILHDIILLGTYPRPRYV